MTNNHFIDIWKQFCVVVLFVCVCWNVGYYNSSSFCVLGLIWFGFVSLFIFLGMLLISCVCVYTCVFKKKHRNFPDFYAVSEKKSLTTKYLFWILFYFYPFRFLISVAFMFLFYCCCSFMFRLFIILLIFFQKMNEQ